MNYRNSNSTSLSYYFHYRTYRMTSDLRSPHPIPNGESAARVLNVPDLATDDQDLTPSASPTSSPMVGQRHRCVSVSNPEPVIRMVAEGLIQKGRDLEEFLEDKLLISVLDDADGLVKPGYRGEWEGGREGGREGREGGRGGGRGREDRGEGRADEGREGRSRGEGMRDGRGGSRGGESG